MQSDLELRQAVMDELEWNPSVNAAEIGVEAKDGVVTLAGHVASYSEKLAAERTAQRVSGVKALASEIDVRLLYGNQRTDAEIAEAAIHALDWNTNIPEGEIKVKVSDGRITLTGEVDWEYQRHSAERAVRHLRGVRGLDNAISLKPKVMPADVTKQILAALQRQALQEARNIEVSVENNSVTLRGRVHSLADREAAELAVWAAPGVADVRDYISVE